MRNLQNLGVILLILAALLAVGCTESADEPILEEQGPPPEPISTESAKEEAEEAAREAEARLRQTTCNWDWTFYTTDYIGDYYQAPYQAPPGYTYAIASVYLKNNGDTKVSTNSFYWKMIVDGVVYSSATETYASGINHQTVDVYPGGEFETRFVYVVPDGTTQASIIYEGVGAPDMTRINYYQA